MTSPIAELLERARIGDQSALNELVTVLYGELHRIATRHLRNERGDHTLQPTALVHEAYLKLFEDSERRFTDRVHFLSVASRVMRQILVDYARSRAAKKRSGTKHGDLWDVSLTTLLEPEGDAGVSQLDFRQLDRALDRLSCEDESLAKLIEMHYFGGMTAEETAEVLGRSVHVVRHDLRLARAWLRPGTQSITSTGISGWVPRHAVLIAMPRVPALRWARRNDRPPLPGPLTHRGVVVINDPAAFDFGLEFHLRSPFSGHLHDPASNPGFALRPDGNLRIGNRALEVVTNL